MKKTIIGLAAMAMLTGTAGFAAAGDANLEAQIQQLIKQNKILTERVMKLEQQNAGMKGERDIISGDKHEQITSALGAKELNLRVQRLEEQLRRQKGMEEGHGGEGFTKGINDHVELSGLIEVEAKSLSQDGHTAAHNENSSDINVTTVQVALDSQLSEWSSGHILVLYEEDEDADFNIDEATITLGNLEKFPLYLTAGKMYVPFGCFQTNMISDPLTLELGETNETAVQVGFESAGFYGSVYGFNGDISESGESDKIDAWGANVGYAFANDNINFVGGVDYINNIADSDTITEHIHTKTAAHEVEDYVDGVAVHASLAMGPFNVIGEYVAALDNFESSEFAFDSGDAEPEAWNIEAAFTTELMEKEMTFALGYQGTDEAAELQLPEDAYVGTVRVEIFHNTEVAFEYAHLEYYSEDEGSHADDADLATLQLAVEF